MHLEKREIECYLYLYPYAKKHLRSNNVIHVKSKYFAEKYNMQNMFYSYLMKTVEIWFDGLDDSDIELIKLRYFQNYSYAQIAYQIHYSNHSSIVKRISKILKRLGKDI